MDRKVVIIILNWNGWEDTIECLESLYQITYPNYDVIVVDNGSEDESIEKIKDYVEGKIKVESKFFEYEPSNKPIRIIEYTREEAEAGGGKQKEIEDVPSNRKMIIIKNEKNYGFAEGNNIGMRYALKALNPDYVLLLNNDTVVDKEFLGELVKVAESDKKIGIVGPKMYYTDRPDVLWFAGGKINWYLEHYQIGQNQKDTAQFDEISKVDFISGACMSIKREIVEKIGMLPKEYFLGFEDIDYCVNAIRHHYKCVYVPKSKIWHKKSASYTRGRMADYQIELGFKNRIIFRYKYLATPEFILYIICLIHIVIPIHFFYRIAYSHDLRGAISLLKGAKEGIKSVLMK